MRADLNPSLSNCCHQPGKARKVLGGQRGGQAQFLSHDRCHHDFAKKIGQQLEMTNP